jgi:hypothetical protein
LVVVPVVLFAVNENVPSVTGVESLPPVSLKTGSTPSATAAEAEKATSAKSTI